MKRSKVSPVIVVTCSVFLIMAGPSSCMEKQLWLLSKLSLTPPKVMSLFKCKGFAFLKAKACFLTSLGSDVLASL